MREHPLQQHYEREAAGRRVDGRTIVFPTETLDALAADARKRGITVNEMARRIVDQVAEDRLVDAVLDDQSAAAGIPLSRVGNGLIGKRMRRAA